MFHPSTLVLNRPLTLALSREGRGDLRLPFAGWSEATDGY